MDIRRFYLIVSLINSKALFINFSTEIELVVAPVTKCEPVEVKDVSDTERGAGGFGSTGV